MINPYLDDTNQIQWLPTIPKNYGVSSKPFMELAIWLTASFLLFTAGTIIAIVNGWVLGIIVFGFLSALSIIILAIFYKQHRINITRVYKAKYLKEVYDFWFNAFYKMKLHYDDLNLLTNGVPIMVGEDFYLVTRESKEGKNYLSFATADELEINSANQNTLHPNPRVNLQTKAEHARSTYSVPENYGYTIVHVDGKTIALPVVE